MSTELKIPNVGESVNEVILAQWLKSDGDYVEMDEMVFEIESDKASMEVPAPASGALQIKVQEGETVSVGDVVALIDESAEKPADSGAEDAEEHESADQKSEKKEKSTEKAQPKAEDHSGKKEKEAPKEETEESKDETEEATDGRKIRVSPIAAKILQDAGISASTVQGTGTDGRVTKQDALNAVEAKQEEAKKSAEKAVKQADKPTEPEAASATPERGERRAKMSTLRKTIARRLVESKNQTAMLTTFNEVDMSAIMAVRKKYKEKFQEKYDVKLGFMSFFTKAVCNALKDVPAVNGQIDGDEIVYHDYCDISVAVSTPRGLVTPVIRNAEKRSYYELEAEILRLAEKARDGKLTIDEMTGGTFTITNGGIFGSLLSTPIINIPQTAILGMHTIQERPMAINGEVVIRPMMYVALSYDHRLIDGRESVTFLIRVKEQLEDPTRMLLDL